VEFIALFHLGVVKALNDQHLLPRIISGSSVGALVASLVCIHTDDELPVGRSSLTATLQSLTWTNPIAIECITTRRYQLACVLEEKLERDSHSKNITFVEAWYNI
jgi:predicted acylesterase/phospholipase RssA